MQDRLPIHKHRIGIGYVTFQLYDCMQDRLPIHKDRIGIGYVMFQL